MESGADKCTKAVIDGGMKGNFDDPDHLPVVISYCDVLRLKKDPCMDVI